MAAPRLTLTQMAERLNLSPKTLRKYVLDLDIPHYATAGRNLRFDPATVEAYLMVTEKPEKSNVVYLPVSKKKGKKVVTSRKFAEAV